MGDAPLFRRWPTAEVFAACADVSTDDAEIVLAGAEPYCEARGLVLTIIGLNDLAYGLRAGMEFCEALSQWFAMMVSPGGN